MRQAQEQRRVLREQFRSAGGEFLWKEFGKKTTTYNYSEQMLVLRQCRYCPIPKGIVWGGGGGVEGGLLIYIYFF